MIGTVLKQQGAIDEAVIGSSARPSATCRCRPKRTEPRPGAEPAGRTVTAGRAELAEADRLTTADGGCAGLDVRGQRRRCRRRGRADYRGGNRALSRGHPHSRTTTRRRIISSRSRCGAPAPRPRRTATLRDRATPRALPPSPRQKTSHDLDDACNGATRAGAASCRTRRVLAFSHARAVVTAAMSATCTPGPHRGARLLVREHGTRSRPHGDHRLRREGDQQVPARNDRLRRGGARHRRRRLARHLRRQRLRRSKASRPGRSADRPSLSQPAGRHLRGRDREVRASSRAAGGRARARPTTTTTATTISSSPPGGRTTCSTTAATARSRT